VRLFNTEAGLRCYLRQQTRDDRDLTVGLVPTMGALHAGHLSLIRRARQETGLVVVSIFVNPLQFGPGEDFQHYPRTLDHDRQQCEDQAVDVLFVPTAAELGIPTVAPALINGAVSSRGCPAGDPSSSLVPNAELFADTSQLLTQSQDWAVKTPDSEASVGLTQVVPPPALVNRMCGLARPGHFQGVATIVTKLLNLVQPDRAYFGQKDAQQLAIIRRLVRDLNFSVEIVGCPTVRDPDGLALSSRNQYLSDSERSQALGISRSLNAAQQQFQQGERSGAVLVQTVQQTLKAANLEPEYVELVHPDTLTPLDQVTECGLLALAVRVGSTRLIDNCLLRTRQPIVAIDGPAGAGKTTVTRQVAERLGLLHLDSGAMYRAVTWLILHLGLALDDKPAIADLASQCQIQFHPPAAGSKSPVEIEINGHLVTQAIRNADVTAAVSQVAAQPAVRKSLVRQQQRYGQQGGIVMEGRDIGTQVFPDAELKIFLTASVQERARRRQQDLQQQGLPIGPLAELEQAIYDRDYQDSTRSVSPLCKAEDAIEIQTDGLTINAVIDRIVDLYQQITSSKSVQMSIELKRHP